MNNLVSIEYKGKRLDNIQNKFKIEEPVLIEIVKSDPTQNKKYTEWLVRLYSNDLIKMEDLYKATQYLKVFNRCVEKRLIDEDKRDINKYKSLQELFNIVEKYIDSEDILHDEEIEDKTLVFESKNWKVHIPQTFKESQVLGSGTQWCTSSSNSEDTFNSYNKNGFLIIFMNKNSEGVEGKFQLHIQSEQFADYKDTMQSFLDFLKEHTELHPFMKEHLKQEADSLEERVKEEDFWLCYRKEIKDIEKLLNYYVYSEKIYQILQTSEEILCNVRFLNLKNICLDKIKRIRGSAYFRGYKGELPKLKEIGGSAYFRGYNGEMPKLEKIGGYAYFENSGVNVPKLKEIGGYAYFRGYKGELPKLEKIGGDADFIGYTGEMPKLKEIGGLANFENSEVKIPKLKEIGGRAYFRGYKGELPKLEKIGGDADFRGYNGEMPELEKIGGNADFRGYKGELPKLKEIGGLANFENSEVKIPKLKELGGGADFRGYNGELPKLEKIGGMLILKKMQKNYHN